VRGGSRSRRPPSEKSAWQSSGGRPSAVKRKLIGFEPEIYDALTLLARDRMQDFQELADEAFRDLLKKHARPVTLKGALRESVGRAGAEPVKTRRKPTPD
jgi:hypothetical protein